MITRTHGHPTSSKQRIAHISQLLKPLDPQLKVSHHFSDLLEAILQKLRPYLCAFYVINIYKLIFQRTWRIQEYGISIIRLSLNSSMLLDFEGLKHHRYVSLEGNARKSFHHRHRFRQSFWIFAFLPSFVLRRIQSRLQGQSIYCFDS